jgi:transposase
MSELPSDWKRVFDRLERDRDDQAARADRLQDTLDRVADQLAHQTDELRAITKMLRRRDAQLAKSEAMVRKLRRQLGLDDPDPDPGSAAAVPDAGATSPSTPSPVLAHSTDDPPEPSTTTKATTTGTAGPDATPDAVTSSDGVEQGSRNPQDKSAPERTPRVGGRGRPPKHLHADVETHTVSACGCCGGRVLQRDVEETEVFSAVKAQVRRRVIRRQRVICANPLCGKPTTAPMPPMPCERALFDCAFIAWIVTMKFAYLMPLDRIQAMLASQGVIVSIGTLVHLVERATSLADAVDGEHMRQLRAGKYVCFDGTGLKVLIPGQPKAWDGYLEVYTRQELTVFQFDLTKHADELRDRLSAITAVLVTDAESRNKAGAPNVEFSNCNAHVVRALRAAAQVQPVLAKEGRAFFEAIYDVEERAREQGLTGAALRTARQECRPIVENLRRWLNVVADGDLPPSDPVRKVAKYYLRHWDGLTRFLDDPEVPLDNNEAEREFQRHAKLRLASLFAGSVEGAHRWATLLGVVRTAQKHGLDVQAYLTWMFERRGTHRGRYGLSAKDLTPAAYKASGCPGSLQAERRAA